jgi:hypothetical protein
MSRFKQVIVVRNDLNMRKGKMVAQGAHASIMFLVHCLCDTNAVAKDQMIHRASQTLVSSSDPSKGGADDGLSILSYSEHSLHYGERNGGECFCSFGGGGFDDVVSVHDGPA